MKKDKVFQKPLPREMGEDLNAELATKKIFNWHDWRKRHAFFGEYLWRPISGETSGKSSRIKVRAEEATLPLGIVHEEAMISLKRAAQAFILSSNALRGHFITTKLMKNNNRTTQSNDNHEYAVRENGNIKNLCMVAYRPLK